MGELSAIIGMLSAMDWNDCPQSQESAPVITLCYEVGYDAFWLARFLKARGIECLVIDPGSLQVNRRGRRVKTDRVDVKMLLRTLIACCRGERHVWSPVRIPSVEEEDLRRSHRERSRLVRERTALRMTAHSDGATSTEAVVRNPPKKETAMRNVCGCRRR
jgi:transposase